MQQKLRKKTKFLLGMIVLVSIDSKYSGLEMRTSIIILQKYHISVINMNPIRILVEKNQQPTIQENTRIYLI